MDGRRLRSRTVLAQKLSIPRFGGLRSARQGAGTPDDRQRRARREVSLGPLGVFDGVSARPLGVEETEQSGQLDHLTSGVEDIAVLWPSNADAQRLFHGRQIDHADGQPTM